VVQITSTQFSLPKMSFRPGRAPANHPLKFNPNNFVLLLVLTIVFTSIEMLTMLL